MNHRVWRIRRLASVVLLLGLLLSLSGCFLFGSQVVTPTLAPNATAVVDAGADITATASVQAIATVKQPTNTSASSANSKPSATPTLKPTEEPEQTTESTAEPETTVKPTVKPTAEPAATQKPTLTPTESSCAVAVDLSLNEMYALAGGYAKLGCAIAAAAEERWGVQLYERGWMFWRGPEKAIYVALVDLSYTVRADTWNESMSERSCDIRAPEGLQQPKRGFGLVWCNEEGTRAALGFAQAEEVGAQVVVQRFTGGMIALQSDGTARVFYTNSTWAILPTIG